MYGKNGALKGGLWLFLLASTLPACYQPVEGCLDINAANYDVEADNPCDDCCMYPQLKWRFRHRRITPQGTVNFSYADTLTDDFGQPFRVTRITYYLQGARLVRPDGMEWGVEDTVSLYYATAPGDTVSQLFQDDFFQLNANNFNTFGVGTFREDGTFSGQKLLIGLTTDAARTIPLRAPDNHPLADETLWQADSGYVQCRIELFPGVTEADTILKIINLYSPNPLTEIQGFLPLDIPLGFSPVVIVEVNYAPWFSGVNIRQDATEIIAQKVAENLRQTFTIVETSLELDAP